MGDTATISPWRLRCEYMENPLGITVRRPRLSWVSTSDLRDQRQTAYRVIVASSRRLLDSGVGDLWDTGKVLSSDSHLIEYAGTELNSGRRCFWKVKVWDRADVESEWSEGAGWTIGLLSRSDWKADWIGAPEAILGPIDPEDPCLIPSPYLRNEFALTETPLRATLYATAKGVYEFRINGERVGADLLTPGWTDYTKRIRYQAYDVTRLLRKGDNAAGAVLGTGWYCGHVAWYERIYGKYPSLLARLDIEYADGRIETITTGAGWRTSTGPIRSSDMLQGEVYDARLETAGWDSPGFDARGWSDVTVEEIDQRGPVLENPTGSPIRQIAEITPREITEPVSGAYVYDLGQNMVGTVRLRVAGGAGDTVQLRYAEVVNPDGTIYTENLRDARATDRYTLKGDPAGEEWVPAFTYHGFRYVEVRGLSSPPELGWITGLVIHSEMRQTGSFSCSNELLNRLQHNIEWGQRGNYFDIPTDCPQRDERLGWMGDAQVFAVTGCYNFDTAAFLSKWLIDVRDAQHENGVYTDFAPEPDVIEHNSGKKLKEWRGSPAWADAGIIVPWTVYQRFGDLRVLEDAYGSMSAYMAYIERESADFIGPDFGYGDWLNDFAFTPLDLMATAFNAYSAGLMSSIAEVIGETEDSEKYRVLGDRIKKAFTDRFVTPDGRLVGDTQTAYVLALQFGLLPDRLRTAAVERLVYDIENGRSSLWPYRKREGHVSSGFVGVNLINPTLAEAGRADLAYRLLLNEDYPSWLFQVQNGATTIWERWDGYHPERGFQDPEMNSFNHYAYGAIGQWLYEWVAGIAPLSPGYKEVSIAPRPGGGLTCARGSYRSVYGLIESDWAIQDRRFSLAVSVPCNSTARISLPFGDPSSTTEGGNPLDESQGVLSVKAGPEGAVITVGSGRYRFETQGYR